MVNKTILWPTDFTETASHALRYAVEMANLYKVGLKILHVVPRPMGDENFMILAITPEELAKSMEDAAAEKMKSLLAKLNTDLPVETQIRMGDATDEIIAEANSGEIGMVVIASHGYSGIQHFLHTNVAEAVANGAQCPVLVVK
ncbi:universal stress protein [Shewanella litorisediminis]|uniref:Universal stress protein n=1 Tax=Shewanella litorisediminis TaxID=1173586 RepID=A0ABX7G1J5_9GAMM|nr:universal stress protein [Shewanella litorisediminis]MCL2919038.1 universal stress protein [Shewanella litorisediminis]QRH01102.1 universal stress protein [Shewanella litorisediminis]